MGNLSPMLSQQAESPREHNCFATKWPTQNNNHLMDCAFPSHIAVEMAFRRSNVTGT